MAEECLGKVGGAARNCYEAIQLDTHNRVVQMYLMQPTVSRYVRGEVRDYDHALRYRNYGAYLYAVSKGPPPSVNSVTPGETSKISFKSGGSEVGYFCIVRHEVA